MSEIPFLESPFPEKLLSVERLVSDYCNPFTHLESISNTNQAISGGKKVRALLSLLSFMLCMNSNEDFEIRAAATVELIHNATLMHDDVVDDNHIRRGEPNIKSLYGNKISVLTGDFFLSVAFEIILECKSLEAVSLLSRTAKQLSEGEILQLQRIGRLVTEVDYFEVIGKKTAVLFSAAAEIAAILSNRQKYIPALREAGFAIGIAFQIADDVLDYSESAEIGKQSGNDFRECKFTLPCIIAYRDAKSQLAREFWREKFFAKEKDIEEARFFMGEVDALKKASEIAYKYIEVAEEKLSVFRDSAKFPIMQAFLKYISGRVC